MAKNSILGGAAFEALRRLLDLSAVMQKVHAKNIANAATDGYAKEVVDFDGMLDQARTRLTSTSESHGKSKDSPPGIRVTTEPSEDGTNSVDMETELVALAENQLRFKLGARLTALKIAGLRASIRGHN